MSETKVSYDDWYAEIVLYLESQANLTTCDAQGVIDAQSFYTSNFWAMGLSPEEAGFYLEQASRGVKVNASKATTIYKDIPSYSSHEKEQKAFESLLKTSHKISEKLFEMGDGFYAEDVMGCDYWLVRLDGYYHLVYSPSGYNKVDYHLVININGIDANDMHEVEAEMIKWLNNPIIKNSGDKLKELSETEIDELAEDALNAACLVIQNKLGVSDGGLASVVFSDDVVKNLLMDYIRSEQRNL